MLVGAIGSMKEALDHAAKAGIEVVVMPKDDLLKELASFMIAYNDNYAMSLPMSLRLQNEPWRHGRKDARFKRKG